MKKNCFVVLTLIILISFSFLFSSCKFDENISDNGMNNIDNPHDSQEIEGKDDRTIKLNLYIDENEILTWDEVENAISYDIMINDKIINSSKNEANIFWNITDYCEYQIKIKVLYEEEKYDISETVKYQVPMLTDFEWKNTSSGDIKITKLTTSVKGKVIIPSKIGDKEIVSIESKCFFDCDEITGIITGPNIEEIGYQAFSECDNLKFANVNNVKKIRNYAFSNCKQLEKVMYDSLEEINGGIFSNTALDELYVSKNVKKITGLYGFGNGNLTRINVATDNEYFYVENNCLMTYDKTLIRPYGIFSIPADTKILGTSAFYGMDIEEIEIPDGVEKIDDYCFAECALLSQVLIPDSVLEIVGYAFKNCSSLKNVILSSKLTSLSSLIFTGCINLESIDMNDSDKYIAKDNCIIDKLGNVILGCKTTIIPSNNLVTSIMTGSFMNIGLEKIIIPSNIENINVGCFSNNFDLKEVVFYEGLINIESSAFGNCYSLDKVIIPKSVKRMNGFNNCIAEIYSFKDTQINSKTDLNVETTLFVEEECNSTGNVIKVKEFGYENGEYYIKSIKKTNFSSVVPTRKGYKFMGWSLSENKDDIISSVNEREIVRISNGVGLTVVRTSIGRFCDVVSFNSNVDVTRVDTYYAIWEKEE